VVQQLVVAAGDGDRHHSQSSAGRAEDYEETLQLLRKQLLRPAAAERVQKVREHAAAVGADFELRLGYHLGAVG
jgi:hypothetical protein